MASGWRFYEIQYESEKVGGSLRPLNQMSGFHDVISSCILCDLNAKAILLLGATGDIVMRSFSSALIGSYVILNGSVYTLRQK